MPAPPPANFISLIDTSEGERPSKTTQFFVLVADKAHALIHAIKAF
jgi:hypothetical protein